MDLYIYVIVHDRGFAPNPFFGYCTLATCKPHIRNRAQVDDWIVGVGSRQKKQDGKLVYAMKIEEILTYEEYWEDPRFVRKRPNRSGSLKLRYGDNIYHRSTDRGEWLQEDSAHSQASGIRHEGHIRRDTGAPLVLTSQTFVYFGASAIPIPNRFITWAGCDVFTNPIRDYRRRNYPPGFKEDFLEWIESLPRGIEGEPFDWPG